MSVSVSQPLADPLVAETFRPLFEPKVVAVVGASTRGTGVGVDFLRNLRASGFEGIVYAIHPEADEIEGFRAFKSFQDVPEVVDYAYYTIPAEAVPTSLEDASGKLRIAQLITGGFSEHSEEGAVLEAEALAVAAAGGIRVIGPNCAGTYSPRAKMTFTQASPAEPGRCGIISESGGLSIDMIRRGGRLGVRFSGVVSIGNAADVKSSELLKYFLNDSGTDVVGMYLESSRSGAELVELLRTNGGRKPVVLLKGGRTGQGSRAAASHTGALASDGRVWEGIAAQTGCVLVDTVDEFTEALLAVQGQGWRATPAGGVVLFGNGGGASVLAADSFARCGLNLTEFSGDTVDQLTALNLPPGTSVRNPIDAPATTLRVDKGAVAGRILEAALSGTEKTWALVTHVNLPVMLPTHGDPAAGREVLDNLLNAVSDVMSTRPDTVPVVVLRTEHQGLSVEVAPEIRRTLLNRGFLVYEELEDAARALSHLKTALEFAERRAAEGPTVALARPAVSAAHDVVRASAVAGREAMSESDAKSVLTGLGIRVPNGIIVDGTDDIQALEAQLSSMKAPYVVKLHSDSPIHKSDVGGVRLNCHGAQDVADAIGEITANGKRSGVPDFQFLVEEQIPSGVEMVLGGYYDPEIGPIAMLGTGGILVEALGDIAFAACPVSREHAARMLESLQMSALLDGLRGSAPLAKDRLLDVFDALAGPGGLLASMGAAVAEVDLNPVIVTENDAVAVDARILLGQG